MLTYGQSLEECQKCISTVMKNQEYRYEGRTYRRADLKELNAREKYLISRIEMYGDVLPTQIKSSHGAYSIEFHQ